MSDRPSFIEEMERFARVAMLRQFCSIMFPSWGSDMSFIDKTIRHFARFDKDYFNLFSHHNTLTLNDLRQAGAAPRNSLQHKGLRVGTINALGSCWLRGYPKSAPVTLFA
jgi:hypothetical protein